MRHALYVITLGLVVMLAGCAESIPDFERIGVARTADGEGLVLHLATCPNEAVDAVAVFDVNGDAVGDDDDETLWRIEADGQAGALARVEVGSVPPGFREVVRLEKDLSQQSLNVVFEGQPGAEMQLSDQWDEYPRNGKVEWAGNRLTPERFAPQVFEAEPDVCD